jgi:Right handed beta helix region
MKFNSRTTAIAGVAALIASGLVVGTPNASQALVPVEVINTNDSGVGSLRQAILDANDPALPFDQIIFNIALPGVQVIAPLNDLPDITAPVTIDGYTQPGATPATNLNAANPLIVLDAALMSEGLQISTDDSKVRGLVIRDAINGASGGGDGIRIDGNGNKIAGNYLGVTASGLVGAGNEGRGVFVRGDGNRIGGSRPEDRNVISANEVDGVFVNGASNTVSGNYIGTDETGTADLGNDGHGVLIDGADNLVGGASSSAGNVTSGNRFDGISVGSAASTGTEVRNNFVGVSSSGILGLGNDLSGVYVEADDTELVGNVISANGEDGVEGDGNDVRLFQNKIGTNSLGTAALGNGADGVNLDGQNVVVGSATQGNQVSGNADQGIELFGADNALVQGNLVGTDSSGAVPLGNGDDGISVTGEAAIVDGNRVAASGGVGIYSSSDNAEISGNIVGGVGLGNADYGIHTADGPSLTIANRVSRNLLGGISVTGPEGQTLSKNRITQNLGLGIDLAGNGVVEVNDAFDVDTGPNGLLNFPVITAATVVGGNASVSWLVNGLPSTAFTLEFFASAACNPGAPNGEGARFLGSLPATTGAAGFVSGNGVLGAATVGEFVTATATDTTTGSTSEFSVCTQLI